MNAVLLLREKLNCSQRDMAHFFQLTRSMYVRFENEKARLIPEALNCVAFLGTVILKVDEESKDITDEKSEKLQLIGFLEHRNRIIPGEIEKLKQHRAQMEVTYNRAYQAKKYYTEAIIMAEKLDYKRQVWLQSKETEQEVALSKNNLIAQRNNELKVAQLEVELTMNTELLSKLIEEQKG
jgi:transcriptional regulator with XRE-family HTH domain